MYYSDSIITSIEAEKILALKLESALTGVKKNVIDTLKQMGDGFTRATYYSSCFMENYQDVCTRLKYEDVRFISGLIQLVKDRNIIFLMMRIYIEIHFKNKKEGQVQNIVRKLVGAGVHISTTGLTNRLLISSVAVAICQSFTFNALVYSRISRLRSLMLKGSVTTTAMALNIYGLVQQASISANNLKRFNVYYYQALYEYHLEMMYLFIEPVITKNPYLNPAFITDDALVDLIIRLVK